MRAKQLLGEINKSKRFLPAELEEVEVVISKNNTEISFYFIKDDEILYDFDIEEVN